MIKTADVIRFATMLKGPTPALVEVVLCLVAMDGAALESTTASIHPIRVPRLLHSHSLTIIVQKKIIIARSYGAT